MINLPGVLQAAAEVQRFCEARKWPFCFIGGVAVQRWGEPRLTQDVDLTVLTGFGNEEKFASALLSSFAGRIEGARDFAVKHRVLLARTASGVAIDAAFGALPFEEHCIQRASPWMWDERQHPLLTCSAEDLVVHKVFAGRDRDWGDVESILVRQHGKLDFDLIRSELPPLLELKGMERSIDRLEQLSREASKRVSQTHRPSP